jgi:phosphoribosylglycinamide formyltransferase-1
MSLNSTTSPLRLVVLFSGRGSNLAAIVDAIQQGRLHADIAGVVCNRPDAPGLDIASHAGLPTSLLDHTRFTTRDEFDLELVRTIDQYAPDWVVLAGFMRMLTPATVHHYHNRLINIHPSLLPAFPGLDTHRRAIQTGSSQHGASVHLVHPAMDSGPVIAQAIVTVLPNDTPEQLAEHVLAIRAACLETG